MGASPPPLWGGVRGGGRVRRLVRPPTPALPTVGEGGAFACGAGDGGEWVSVELRRVAGVFSC